MTPAQLRMARAAVRLGVREVAALAGITPQTVSRYENEQGDMRHETAQRLEATLSALGVSFVTQDGRACICYSPPATASEKPAG